ncbi:hypothetical protein N7495_006444 [Penicillium taxi]|uniref:uncharacterized protein n=1 Tax=Penicillium taxi TaxID=168475 RepID=UPI0025456E97|nr:uncharacterized protein N7495_006444 [Penicillium taxi]KAJ5894753.1 hypothetical protein N7495_006444 [Penicillium taxi]
MPLDAMVGQSQKHSPKVLDLASINEIPNMPAPAKENKKQSETVVQAHGNHPPPKTDKPRPHGCTTCGRSFARLEHLKRHERSHTKEKPFECPDCSRCFARRDLLLRHQQKLHMTTTPSSRPRNARRESTGTATSAAANRVRKNSIANNSSVRPRANTISHVDGNALGIASAGIANTGIASSTPKQHQHQHQQQQQQQQQQHPYHHPSLSSSVGSSMDYRFGSGHQAVNGLSKIETSGLPMNMSGGLRTAPVYGSFDMGIDGMLMGHGSTINPAQLHFAGSPQGFGDSPSSPFGHHHHGLPPSNDPMMDDEMNFDWMNGFDTAVALGNGNDSVVDESSPSAMSTGSQSGISEAMIDGPNRIPISNGWHNPFPVHTSASANQFAIDFSPTTLNEFGIPPETVSPKSLMNQNPFVETYATPPSMTSVGQPILGHSQSMFSSSMATSGESPNLLNVPFPNSALRNQHSSISTDSFTDSTRQALLTSMSQPTGFNHRKYSQPASGLLSSRELFARSTGFKNFGSLPSTPDIQRYISAYLSYFHPHMPFLHVPTLNFQAPEYTNNLRMPSGHLNLSSTGVSGGGGCLILSIAAIGALYEHEVAASKDLFEAAKKMIQLYLEERRKADMSAALKRSNNSHDNSVQNTPLWLVQAMLLNVIYGHACADKTSADIASTHCAALVSLARAAELTHHLDPKSLPQDHLTPGINGLNDSDNWMSSSYSQPQDRREWLNWKIVEERKRTLFAIFALSSFIVSAYNHAPALTNSEIRLDLPCEENLWAADSPHVWKQIGGLTASKKSVSFSSALTSLLTASQREQNQSSNLFYNGNKDEPSNASQPSTFGCLVLIYSLHNYIWETRQRHMGRQWTTQETEAMQSHIEPALRAWQTAWASNPVHSLERPNPFGAGPLSADSIPLLDLAYVRLFVNLGRCKEAFWQRDWNGMADELARGMEVFQHAADTAMMNDLVDPTLTGALNNRRESINDLGVGDLAISKTPTQEEPMQKLSGTYKAGQSKREKHLRKAAFYAADSISMSDRLGNTYAEFSSRELPIQCALCTFDCAQVLAEWITIVQERVGPYLGILGRDYTDLTQVPGVMLLEEEECKLVEKIKDILQNIETKMQHRMQKNNSMSALSTMQRLPSAVEGGYGCKILIATASLLDQAAVWPVTKLMARSLEAQAIRMKERAEHSVMMTT